MNTIKIHQEKAVKLLKEGIPLSAYEIEFDSEPLCAEDALLIGRNGFEVPDELISYDDGVINFDDLPSVTEEDVSKGKIQWLASVEIPIEPEITNWINQQKIDLNELLGNLQKTSITQLNQLRNMPLYK